MKKTLIALNICLLLLTACEDNKVKEAKAKLEEYQCRLDFVKSINENGLNIKLLLKEEGFGKDLENYMKIQSDSTTSCDSLKSAWAKLTAKLEK